MIALGPILADVARALDEARDLLAALSREERP